MGKFARRRQRHDELENNIMDIVRPFTDRRHLPDRRVSFGGIPCSFDVKSNIFVEDSSHDEYVNLWNEGEPVFIVFTNKQEPDIIYADWIIFLMWQGPFPATERSTSGDPFYRIASNRTLEEFLAKAKEELTNWFLPKIS